MENIKTVDFSVAGVITVILTDDTTEVFTTAPVVAEDKSVTVMHANGTTETFAPTPAAE